MTTDQQLERQRAARQRWRERNREAERERVRRRSGGAAAGQPDGAPDPVEVLALRARVAELEAVLEAQSAELDELRAYRENDRERSRRNRDRRRNRSRVRSRPERRPDATGAPLARDVQSGPPEYEKNYQGVSLAAVAGATRARDGAAAAAAATAPAACVDPWTEPTVLELLGSKNLLVGPTRTLMAQITGAASTSNLREVLKFVTRQFAAPAATEAPSVEIRRAGHRIAGSAAPDPSLAWIAEAEAACVAEQDRMLAAAGFQP